MKHLALLLSCTLLAGCAASAVTAIPSKITRPSSRVMGPPEVLPPVKPGDDLYESNVQCRAAYGETAAKLRSCQGYIDTILKK